MSSHKATHSSKGEPARQPRLSKAESPRESPRKPRHSVSPRRSGHVRVYGRRISYGKPLTRILGLTPDDAGLDVEVEARLGSADTDERERHDVVGPLEVAHRASVEPDVCCCDGKWHTSRCVITIRQGFAPGRHG